MNQKFKSTITSLLGVKGGKAGKAEPNPATMQRPKSVNLEASPCNHRHHSISLLNIKGGKGKTSTVQTVNVQKMIEATMPTVGFTPRRPNEAGPCSNGCRRFF
jgi:hypothetical protein